MSIPALRQPKFVTEKKSTDSTACSNNSHENMIITLKDDKKLVISSNAYHGIIVYGDQFACVFCQTESSVDNGIEKHKDSDDHTKHLDKYPHMDIYSENLIRKLYNNQYYCSVCHVQMFAASLSRHLASDVHIEGQNRAVKKASAY